MTEKHVPAKNPDQKVITKNPEATEQTFKGAVIGGVFMAPRVDVAPDILAEKVDSIRLHKS